MQVGPLIGSRSSWSLTSIAAVIVAFDLWAKELAEAHLSPAEPVRLIGDAVRLTLVHNSGTAFGLFPGNRLPFILFSLVAIVVIVVMYRRLHERHPVQITAMGLLLGGALGNLHDRIRFGEVTDFLQIGIRGHYWPVFNVADSAITVGVVLLVLTLLRGDGQQEDAQVLVSGDAGDGDEVALPPSG